MCVGVKGVSVPGASTARPSACADQPSRRSTACRGTRRGRPRRRWRARRPPRAAHRCLLYGVRERGHPAPTSQLRRFGHEDSRRGARATPSPRVAGTTGTRRTYMAGMATHVRSPSRHPVSCQRSSDAAPARLRRLGGVGWRWLRCGRGRVGRAGRHGLRQRWRRAPSAAACRRQVRAERAPWPPKFAEAARARTTRVRPFKVADADLLLGAGGAREGLIRGGEHVG